jgi:hypothetical protein
MYVEDREMDPEYWDQLRSALSRLNTLLAESLTKDFHVKVDETFDSGDDAEDSGIRPVVCIRFVRRNRKPRNMEDE